jgi:circadian clock protein KaiC
MSTGVPGLDHLLEGGLVRGNSLLIEGPPGSGKSTLGVRIIAEGISRHDEPGLIITFEEFPRQLYQEALESGVDLRALEESGKLRVVWTPPSRILEGFAGKNDLIAKIVQELDVKRLLIDSITHFKRVAASEAALREVLATVLNNLKLRGINALLVKELERLDDRLIAFEEYLVDSSLRLYNAPTPGGGENLRFVEVRKTRGQGHVSGKHPFELGRRGISVYPRLRPADVRTLFAGWEAPQRARVTTGIPGLDDMLAGGPWSGSLNIVQGRPGTGKSVIAYHFLDQGVRAGEPGLLVSIRNTEDEILAQAESLGIDWRGPCESGQLRVIHAHPSGLCVEKMEDQILQCILSGRPQRLVFDSIEDLESALKDDDRVRDHVMVLASVFNAASTTTLMMSEVRQAAEMRGHDYDYLGRCVVRLSLQEEAGRIRRFVGVKKFAGSDHAKDLREYVIDHRGFHVLEAVTPAAADVRGALPAGCPVLESPSCLDTRGAPEMLRQLERLTECLWGQPGADPERLGAARAAVARLDELVRTHFHGGAGAGDDACNVDLAQARG